MYKLLIVEDEKWEREGLVDFLNWSELNIEIAGTAENGVQGLKLAKSDMPDIIITDIRMPKMDGIEFTRQIKQLNPGCQVIIITGYDDFEYAREAIQLGVYEFLLKPIEKEQMLKVLNKTVQGLSQERERAEYLHTLRRRLDENVNEDREQFLLELAGGDPDHDYDRKSAKFDDMPVFNKDVAAVLIKYDIYPFLKGKEPAERQRCLREMFVRIRSAVGSETIAVQNSAAINEIIVCVPTEGSDRSCIYEVIRRIEQVFQGNEQPEAVIGVGNSVKKLRQFSESFQQAKAALDNMFFTNDSNVLFFADAIQRENIADTEDYSFFASAVGYSKKVLKGIASEDTEGIAALSEELFEFIKDNACDKGLICNFIAGLVSELSTLLLNSEGTLDIEDMALGDLSETLNSFIRLENMKKWFLELLLSVDRVISGKKENKEEYIVGKVMDIIRKEYKDSIGIETIAARLELSPNYLGGLFGQYMGKHFTDVLLDFRMKKAEELLASGLANVSDTAREVGFVNAAHFCTVFKKKHGISPMNFQKKCLHKSAQHE